MRNNTSMSLGDHFARFIDTRVQTCIAQVISRFSRQVLKKHLNQYFEKISGAICESPYRCEFRLG